MAVNPLTQFSNYDSNYAKDLNYELLFSSFAENCVEAK